MNILKHFVVLFLFSVVLGNLSFSQILYPGVTGEALLDKVQADFTPTITFSYAEARDTLYGRIDVQNDFVNAVYTDFAVFLTPNTDPTTTLFSGGINTEHIYPQGKGATDGSAAHRNMHHLAPSKVNVNGDRASLPFGDINDAVTDKWYLEDEIMTSIPSNNVDAYSEGTGSFFEPRESVKGNIARAMFYIHAIYRDQVQAKDPNFFAIQQDDLCAWHFADPVDPQELMRTQKIAAYQSNMENPFVLDCTLAERMYCSGSGDCLVSTDHPSEDINQQLLLVQDINTNNYLLKNLSEESMVLNVRQFSLDGRLINKLVDQQLYSNDALVLSDRNRQGMQLLVVNVDNGSTFSALMIFP